MSKSDDIVDELFASASDAVNRQCIVDARLERDAANNRVRALETQQAQDHARIADLESQLATARDATSSDAVTSARKTSEFRLES